jgi:hypothetical protein
MMEQNARIHRAEDQLHQMLRGLLGPMLKGLSGFGARWDRQEKGLTLGVYLDPSVDAEKVKQGLPKSIDDLPVRVSRRVGATIDTAASRKVLR